tara:strand:- start:121 stop:1419 length:1299 start_codon:yes stop_codon:yes gene_type:complete
LLFFKKIMIELIIFSLNLFLISLIIFNPILFVISHKNNFFEDTEILIFLVFLINIFLFFSFFNIFNIYSKLIFYLLLLASILFNIIFIKKLIKSNYFLDLFFIFFVSSFLVLNIFSNPSLGWDGNFWIEKAKIFYEVREFEELNYTIFPFYPHLGGYIWGFFWKNSFFNYEIIGRASYILIYVFSIFQLCSKFKSNNYNKFLYSLILIFLTYRLEYFTGYQDILIFSFILISYILLNRYKENPNIISLIVFNFSIFLLLWIKNEGVIAYSIFFILFLYNYKKNRIKNHLYIFTILFFVFLITKFLIFSHLNDDLILQEGISIQNFYSNLKNPLIFFSKIFIIIKYFFIKIFYMPIFVIIFLLILFTKSISKEEIVFFIFVIILYSAPYMFSSDASDSERLIWHLKTSYDRMLLQCMAFFLPYTLKIIKIFNK